LTFFYKNVIMIVSNKVTEFCTTFRMCRKGYQKEAIGFSLSKKAEKRYSYITISFFLEGKNK